MELKTHIGLLAHHRPAHSAAEPCTYFYSLYPEPLGFMSLPAPNATLQFLRSVLLGTAGLCDHWGEGSSFSRWQTCVPFSPCSR